jgi:hypothetical protein
MPRRRRSSALGMPPGCTFRRQPVRLARGLEPHFGNSRRGTGTPPPLPASAASNGVARGQCATRLTCNAAPASSRARKRCAAAPRAHAPPRPTRASHATAAARWLRPPASPTAAPPAELPQQRQLGPRHPSMTRAGGTARRPGRHTSAPRRRMCYAGCARSSSRGAAAATAAVPTRVLDSNLPLAAGPLFRSPGPPAPSACSIRSIPHFALKPRCSARSPLGRVTPASLTKQPGPWVPGPMIACCKPGLAFLSLQGAHDGSTQRHQR